MKTNTIKKVISIVIITLVLLLVAATITLACVKNPLYNPLPTNYDYIDVYNSNGSATYYLEDGNEKNNTIYNTIAEKHNETLKANLLSEIFQGALKYKAKVTNTAYSNIQTIINEASVCVVFNFLESQTLELNGEVYKDDSSFAKEVKYNQIVMPVANESEFQECIMYLVTDKTEGKSAYQVKFLAHQGELYSYIDSLSIAGGR